jgi:tetratricopeptide (TPR) repeat protein
MGRLPEAGNLAAKLFAVHNDTAAITSYCDALVNAGHYSEALKVYSQHADRLLAGDSARVLESLHSIIGHVRENTNALETVLEILNKAGESTHVTEIYELLAHAFVQAGQLEKARDYYLKLTQLEPQNQLHARNYQQVMAKLGGSAGAHLITAEEGAVLVDELEATAPSIDQRYDDDVALTVRAALTDAELFVSYNMPAKALGPLLSALPLAPMDLRLNQRLVALHTRASRFAEAALCCRNLQKLYHEARHPDEATRYGELAAMYEERAGLSAKDAASGLPAVGETGIVLKGDPIPPFESTSDFDVSPEVKAAAPAADVTVEKPSKAKGLFFHAPSASPQWQEPKPPAAAEFDVQAPGESEIDISDEWEG